VTIALLAPTQRAEQPVRERGPSHPVTPARISVDEHGLGVGQA
jgi:hypothetical protein